MNPQIGMAEPRLPSALAALVDADVTGEHQMEPEPHWSLRSEGYDRLQKRISSLQEAQEGSVVSNSVAG